VRKPGAVEPGEGAGAGAPARAAPRRRGLRGGWKPLDAMPRGTARQSGDGGGETVRVFVCSVCGHIQFGAAPETCPVCHAKQQAFKEQPDAIKQPANPNALTDGDKKHIPKIVVVKKCGLVPEGCVDVHVRVGEILHVMQPAHWIRYIDFYLDRKYVARVSLTPEKCNAAAGLHLNATSGTVTAIENCNVHGNWMSEVAL
jgi:superoxide reductase